MRQVQRALWCGRHALDQLTPVGLVLRMRGLNARVVTSGVVMVGDRVRKI